MKKIIVDPKDAIEKFIGFFDLASELAYFTAAGFDFELEPEVL